jgi:hypothetical protein
MLIQALLLTNPTQTSQYLLRLSGAVLEIDPDAQLAVQAVLASLRKSDPQLWHTLVTGYLPVLHESSQFPDSFTLLIEEQAIHFS